MKKLLLISTFVALLGLAACTTTQQKTSYNTLATLEISTQTAYHGYINLVIRGELRTNDVPQITHLYNTFQASVLLAESAVEYNTNALASTALAQESFDLINLINTINQKTKPTN